MSVGTPKDVNVANVHLNVDSAAPEVADMVVLAKALWGLKRETASRVNAVEDARGGRRSRFGWREGECNDPA